MSTKHDTHDESTVRQVRYSREVEQQLRQFLKLETGLGNSDDFKDGWEVTFGLTEQEREKYNELREQGISRGEALLSVKALRVVQP